jgi:two-component system nitrogen regulation sensor histidine kinase NtrY
MLADLSQGYRAEERTAWRRIVRVFGHETNARSHRSSPSPGAAMKTRLPGRIGPGPSVVVAADGDQLDQLLINLLRDAVAAALETGGGVRVAWATRAGTVEVTSRTTGPDCPKPGNLVVPSFTSAQGRAGPSPAAPRTTADHRRPLSRR